MNIQNEIESTIGRLIFKLSSLSQDEINTIPDSGGWTPGQIGEHLLKSYHIAGLLMGPTQQTFREPDQKVKSIADLFLNFDLKMKSPEDIAPSQSVIDQTFLIQNLENKKVELLKMASSLDLTLTCTAFAIPQYGEFTRLEWLSFVVVHTKRHLHQLDNIMSEEIN